MCFFYDLKFTTLGNNLTPQEYILFEVEIQMKKFHIFVFKIKRNLISILLLLFTMFLIVFSKSNVTTARSSLKIWANSVVPSLLPFFIASEMLMYTNLPYLLERLFTPIMKPLFSVSGRRCFCFNYGLA